MNTSTQILSTTCLSLGITATMHGHGSLAVPVSRVYSAYLEGPENPQSEAVREAINIGGTQPLYDWNGLAAFHPGSAQEQSNIDYSLNIPDGQLASAGNPVYAGFDQVREDWPTTAIESGPFEFDFYATTPHEPGIFRAWITATDWDPTLPLNWAQMDELSLGDVTLTGLNFRFDTVLPERQGKHAIYVIWQRFDPVGEGFYAIADVDFGQSATCTADFNNDSTVDGADLLVLLATWNQSGEADLNNDGTIDGADLTTLLGTWGNCP
jgi:chitin-binding protein